jgi:hypothetical protein
MPTQTSQRAELRDAARWRFSALKKESLFHSPVARSKHLAMQADRGITIVSPNLHLIADMHRQVRVEDIDDGVLGVELADLRHPDFSTSAAPVRR